MSHHPSYLCDATTALTLAALGGMGYMAYAGVRAYQANNIPELENKKTWLCGCVGIFGLTTGYFHTLRKRIFNVGFDQLFITKYHNMCSLFKTAAELVSPSGENHFDHWVSLDLAAGAYRRRCLETSAVCGRQSDEADFIEKIVCGT